MSEVTIANIEKGCTCMNYFVFGQEYSVGICPSIKLLSPQLVIVC